MSNIKSIGQEVRGLWLPKIGGFPLTLNVALTTVLRTNVLHCDDFLLMFNSNYDSILDRFWHIWFQKNCDLRIQVRGQSRSSTL